MLLVATMLRLQSTDNKALQAANCKLPQHKVSGKPSAYEVPVSSATRGSMGSSTMGETLSDNEQIYKDSWHKREEIYYSFEKSKSRNEGNNIRFVGRNTNYSYYFIMNHASGS